MTKTELLALEFRDVSYRDADDNFIQEFRLNHSDGFSIRVFYFHEVEIYLKGNWHSVPSCHSIDSLKQLIELFQLPF